jgi:CheY-like chemotaxis protein
MAYRVCVADDDPVALAFLSSALRGSDVETFEAASGCELVELLREKGPFDLVVTDAAMPWANGLQVVEGVRKAGIPTPFLIVTALPLSPLTKRSAGITGLRLLAKPVTPTALRSTALELLGGPSASSPGADGGDRPSAFDER